jgi:hypothetical protein
MDSSEAVKVAYQYLLKISTNTEKLLNFKVEEIKLDEN